MKVNHFTRRRFLKKMARKRRRIGRALEKANPEEDDENCSSSGATNVEEIAWLQREAEAQEKWKSKQLLMQNMIFLEKSDLRPENNSANVSSFLPTLSLSNQNFSSKTLSIFATEMPYSNPLEPGTTVADKTDRQICHFFRKTGSCRFDIRCSRFHDRPVVSNTIVFLNMFSSASLEVVIGGNDCDTNLECDEAELLSEYDDFYKDVEPEFLSFGRILTIRTCRNAMRHLRGNVYVQYRNINDAYYAFSELNGRFFAGKRLTAHFVTISNWRESVCGLFLRNRCPKQQSCNFLHVLLNPGEAIGDVFKFLNNPQYFRSMTPRRRCSSSETLSSFFDGSTPEIDVMRSKTPDFTKHKKSAHSGENQTDKRSARISKRKLHYRSRSSSSSSSRDSYNTSKWHDSKVKLKNFKNRYHHNIKRHKNTKRKKYKSNRRSRSKSWSYNSPRTRKHSQQSGSFNESTSDRSK